MQLKSFFNTNKAVNTLAVLALLAIGVLATSSEAKASREVQWSEAKKVNLNYSNVVTHFNAPGHKGLTNPHVTIKYGARIINETTGEVLKDGDKVVVGSKLWFEFRKHNFKDIYWVGTGHSFDTPYGDWVVNAEPPLDSRQISPDNWLNVCREQDFVGISNSVRALNLFGKKVTKTFNFRVYVPFTVHPPQKSLTNTAGLDCLVPDANGNVQCTVTSPGTISGNFTFNETYGKFYYRYILPQLGCIGVDRAMRASNALNQDYIFEVPTRHIPFNFQAVGGDTNRGPQAPTITGPTQGTTNTSYTFTAQATDPDNDQIRYGIDWNNDGQVNQWVPANGHVASGTAQDFSRQWTTEGSKTFQVLAQDDKGATSGWVSHTITISNPEQPQAQPNLRANVDQPICEANTPTTLAGRIINTGQGNANPSTATIKINGQTVDTIQVPALNPGQRHNVSTTWQAPSAGTYTLEICTDNHCAKVENFTCSQPATPTNNTKQSDAFCTPATQTAEVNQPVTLSSILGSRALWHVGGENIGSGGQITTTFETGGQETINVTMMTPPYLDINGDGQITREDALEIINYLNANGDGPAGSGEEGGNSPWQNESNRFDVNNDGRISPVDAGIVVNHLNQYGAGPLSYECIVNVTEPTGPTPTPTPTPDTGGNDPFRPGPIQETN